MLATQLSATECAVAAIPSPLITIVTGEFVALLATFTVPLMLPDVFGANVTSTIAFCPGAIVDPLVPPLAVKPAPLIVTPENVTLELPVFFSATAKVFELPTFSVPKLKLAGVAVIVRVAAAPVPLTVIVNVLSTASLAIEMLPATYPVTVGA